MKLTLQTQKLQEMVANSVKGASANKMIPITSLMGIEVKDNVLTLSTTDATNHLRIIDRKVDNENFYVVVQAELFSKLVAKTSTETMTMTLKENSLEVKGNGTYHIDLPLDEDGKLIKFPEFKFDRKSPVHKINLTTINAILNTNKAALAETMETPCLTGYYFGENVITTDTFKVCCNDIKVFDDDRPLLLSAELINLLSLMTTENIDVQASKDKLLFTTENVVVFGSQLDGISDYPADAIAGYLQTEFESVCKLPRSAFLAVLDRLALFVSDYDKNGIFLTFTNDGLMIMSKKQNGSELIKYQGSDNFQPFTCCVDIVLLQSQVAAQDGETTELWYGHPSALKMTNGKVTQIVALLEDDRAANDGSSES